MNQENDIDEFAEIVAAVVRRDWRLFGLQEPLILRSWTVGRRLLVVFRPLPQTRPDDLYGVDWLVDESPTGLTDATPEERATEVARYLILEPRERVSAGNSLKAEISWVTNVTDGDRPATIDSI
ncbi:hypothetical protein [Rhodococcus sp. 14-2470-1a]|uniref:hypothetical protein n=1 Tax=Rhodococcus sp. 14-2470-1a TaxID=2023150 RepID=UPI000B9B4FE6|nr:hypothetical protein [Rhodococcus sp. 14-2470-1a]OZF42078.1 hypothetical protein CH292_26660 [Rhodococcus sp. 14-2470-1a]